MLSAGWMLQILLFPEFALVNALGEYAIVRSIVAEVKARPDDKQLLESKTSSKEAYELRVC